ncbi:MULTISPECIES: TetR/AcrR family transcriptional regulator [Paenibacillus]|uniref:TetR/AcrR family transcriptional regulator n=1 Tax=Paenibacillus cucumis (ex Kampfer et al. 2016) TaxID=1776858 RepID=A0ABS7KP79_9BACL|nr:TetR/AcrR family transcriptional regulator [Paenibacillus cucumis (ex Kampfer et al. 2016)]MBY0205737.1 TetR/AcrR family transcriptional regulator [Paenibacillus cucumis (ex Kampfer et al. 2016)]MDP9701952.1 AcrR family transcriptional regulator [Paenibacillus intestini]
MKRLENSQKLLTKIIPVLRAKSISSLRMDDIAKHMDISKATLYKYFSSKEEIIQNVLNVYIEEIHDSRATMDDDTISYERRFQIAYEHAMTHVLYLPEFFWNEVKKLYPELYEGIASALRHHSEQLCSFFEKGIEQGIFNRISPVLYMIQDEAVIRRIAEPSFSITQDMTIRQGLFDFYILKKHQLLSPSRIENLDDQPVKAYINELIQQLSRTM